MNQSNAELAEEIARMSFLLGYVRVANTQRLAQVENQLEQLFRQLCDVGLESLARELRQTSERMGYSMGMGEAPPQWVVEYQRNIIDTIKTMGD